PSADVASGAAAGLDRLAARTAERAVFRLPGGRLHRRQGRAPHGEARSAAAPVDERADTDYHAAERLDARHNLADRAARRHHVLDHETALAARDGEPATQPHDAVFPLGEEPAHAEGASDLVSDQDAKIGRAHV